MHADLKYKNLEAKRFLPVSGPVNINNNSTLTAVSKVDEKLEINFVFSSNYQPNIGLIRIEGDLLLSDSKESVDRAIKEWENSGKKNLPTDIAEKVHNIILSNCIAGAVILSREIHLPPPIPTPHVSIGQKGIQSSESKKETESYIR